VFKVIKNERGVVTHVWFATCEKADDACVVLSAPSTAAKDAEIEALRAENERLRRGYIDLLDILPHAEPDFSKEHIMAVSNYIFLKFPEWGPHRLKESATLKDSQP